MAYGIIRVRNLKIEQIKNCEKHNKRLFNESEIPDNINRALTLENYDWTVNNASTYSEAIRQKIKNVATRKNSIVAIEFVLSASKDFFTKGNSNNKRYFTECLKFIRQKFGEENIIAISKHMDESNPHLHVLITPLKVKTVKWKNNKSSGQRTEIRLVARDITGGKEKLRALQDSFYNHIKPIGKACGVEFYRGTLAEQQIKKYQKLTDHRLVDIKNKLLQIENEINLDLKVKLKEEIDMQLAKRDKELNEISSLQNKVSMIKRKNKNNGWKKGFNGWG